MGRRPAMENNEGEMEKCHVGPGPIVFTGVPRACQGYVELINRSAEVIEPRSIAITHLDPSARQKQLPSAIRVSVRLEPHQHLQVPIEVALDPTTPPGTYKGQLSFGSQREDVVINVLESWDLRFVPQSLAVKAGAGAKVARRILVTNCGNIEFTPPASVSVFVDQNLDFGRHLNTALKEAGNEGYQKFLDRFVRELADDAVSNATVQFKCEKASSIHPGETRQVELQIQLPEDLKMNRVYKGAMKFGNTKLLLEVECTGASDVSPRRHK
jgi:hypothetical protein